MESSEKLPAVAAKDLEDKSSLGAVEAAQRPPSSWAQWISAISSLAATTVAVWAIFFSPASHTVVDFLQSELTLRNSKISELEQASGDLRTEIAARQIELNDLQTKINSATSDAKQLADQNKSLLGESEGLKLEIENQKSDLEEYAKSYEALRLKFVAGKFYAMMQGSIVSTEAFRMTGVDDFPLRRVNVWGDYLKFVQNSLPKLSGEERKVGAEIVRRFIRQCKSVGDVMITVGPVSSPAPPYKLSNYYKLSSAEQSKLEKDYESKLQSFQAQADIQIGKVFEIEHKIQNCMQSLN